VLTLVKEAGSVCHGVALQLPVIGEAKILEELDYRERDGYERVQITLKNRNKETFTALTWIADRNNSSWLGDAPMPKLLSQIRAAGGLSGPNGEYVIKIDIALRNLGIVDQHIRSIAERLKQEGN